MGIMWENVGKNYAIEHREESQEEHDKQLEFKLVKEKILKKIQQIRIIFKEQSAKLSKDCI